MRSSQFPPSWENGRAKRYSLEQGRNITSCLRPALETEIFPPSKTLNLWLGREKALPAITPNISDLCSGVGHLETLRVSSARGLFSLPAVALPPTAREEAAVLCWS